MPGQFGLVDGVVADGVELELEPLLDDEPVLEPDVDEPVLVELEELGALAPEVDEPVLEELGVLEPDVAAKATPVPVPTSTPESSSPAANCLVRSLMCD